MAALAWAAAIGSGLLQLLPFPLAGPVPLWRTHVCWFALTPLLWAIVGSRSIPRPTALRAALLGYISGFCWYLGNCYWIFQTMHLYGGLSEPVAAGILILFALYLAIYSALFAWLLALCRRGLGAQAALLLTPVLWVGVELARSRITGFPWDLLGTTQVDNPVLTRLAPWTGVYGLSFVVAAINALWLIRIELRERRWTRTALTAAGVAVVAVLALLTFRPSIPESTGSKPAIATLLQENLEVGAAAAGGPAETEAQLLAAFTSLSERPSPGLLSGMPELAGTRLLRREIVLRPAADQPDNASAEDVSPGPIGVEASDVVLWPESPAPFEEMQPAFRSAVARLARTLAAPVIVGNIGADRGGASETAGKGPALYNSASFVTANGTFAGRYDKMHLVPFGEYVPFKRLFFFAGHLLDEVGTFQPGSERRIFGPFGVFICYESIFGDEIREFSRLGATVLVNLSNDGWYGDTSAPWQHLNMVRMRAIENHRWVLRATNTGITAAIDPTGRVVAAAPRHIRTAIRVPFFYEHDVTFYARHGDLFADLCALGTVAAALLSLLQSRRKAAVN